MDVTENIKDVRQSVAKARADGKTIVLVPTMGALHEGHISLINAAAEKYDFVVVSIFVNPTQFGPSEDLDKYPKPFDRDVKICKDTGAHLVFAPTVNEMYPDENITWVTVEKITKNLCGRSRPIHFRGVTTVCAKLFNIVTPDAAFFGQKDAQQSIVIQRMVTDLNSPLEIVVCPTIREPNGLAVSSRNQYLTDTQKKDAVLLYAALKKCQNLIEQGCYCSTELIQAIQSVIAESSIIKIEYINITNIETLEYIEVIEDKALIAIAVKIGSTRLIDNIMVDLNK